MATLLLESSAIAAHLIEADPWLDKAKTLFSFTATSALTYLEVGRALDRALADGHVSSVVHRARESWLQDFRSRCTTIALNEGVLELARQRFPKEPVRSLDAIHLASALLWMRNVEVPTVASFDSRIRENAVTLGMGVYPPVA